MTPDQIMMFAHLADWAGSKMASDNPFAGYAQQFVGARNYAKMLQPGAAPGAPGAAPTGEAPAAEPSAIAPPSPFSQEYQSPASTMPGPGAGYKFDQIPQAADPDLLSQAMEPGVRALFDEDNNLTLTRKVPAQQQAGAPAKKEAPQKQQNLPSSVTNPFWSLG